MNDVKIYMLSFNHLPFTQQCLEAVWKYTDPKVPILVIDNGSNEETLTWLRKVRDEKKIELLENGRNIGMAPAHNQAIDWCGTSDFCFLSNDIIVGHGWLDKLREGAYKHESIGGASPYISPEVTYDGFANMQFRNEYKRNFQPQLRHDIPKEKLWDMVNEIHNGDFDEFTKTWAETRGDLPPLFEWMTMVLYIKRSTIDKVGKFDPQFQPSHWEDMDYMVRMNLYDLFRITVSDSYVFHWGTITTRGDFHDIDPELHKKRVENEERFHKKWKIFLPYNERRHGVPDGDKYKPMIPGKLVPFEVSLPEQNRKHDKWHLWEPEKYPDIPQLGAEKWKNFFEKV